MAPQMPINLHQEMSPPPFWIPGNFLTKGENTIIDIPTAVSDPSKNARHGDEDSIEDLYKNSQADEWFTVLSNTTIGLLVSCFLLAFIILTLVCYYYL